MSRLERTVLSKEERQRISKLQNLLKTTSQVDRAAGIANYQTTYASKGKIVKGKWVRWDERLNKPYDSKNAADFVKQDIFGTTTPQADLKYLLAKQSQKRKELGTTYNDPIRAKLSRKLIQDTDEEGNLIGPASVYEKEQDTRKSKDEKKLAFLRRKTSFYRLELKHANDIKLANINEKERMEWGPEGQPMPNPVLDDTGTTRTINKTTPNDKDGKAITNTLVGSLEPWRGRGSGRTRPEAVDASDKWLSERLNQKDYLKISSRHDYDEVLEDLRIRQPHVVNNRLQINTGRHESYQMR